MREHRCVATFDALRESGQTLLWAFYAPLELPTTYFGRRSRVLIHSDGGHFWRPGSSAFYGLAEAVTSAGSCPGAAVKLMVPVPSSKFQSRTSPL